VRFVHYLKYSEDAHQQPSIYVSPSIYLSSAGGKERTKEGAKEGRNGSNEQSNKASRDLDLPHSALLVSTQLLTSPRTSSGE
jgi:hypothetical protein